jgi:glycosyltransferase involved in cell wall biosynthesis
VDDVRWFAPNHYTTLVAHELKRQGLTIELEGDAPARVVVAMSASTALPAWRYARRTGCPLLLYLWDLPPKATGEGSYDPVWSVAGTLIRVPRLRGGFGRRRGFYSRLRYIATRAQEVWVPSTLSSDLLLTRFAVPARRVPYCYDSSRFNRSSSVDRDSPPTLLTVGRLKPHKNQVATIRAASRLGSCVQVRLIGRGPEAEVLERLSRSLGVRCRIDTLIDDSGVAEAYHRARVVISPSRFEGFGLSPIEAIACGTPVVASDIPPHREFVGRAARLYPVDDEIALTEAITGALENGPPDQDSIDGLTISAAAERFGAGLRSLMQ